MPDLVRVENLHYAYPSLQADVEPTWVLQGISFRVAAGEFLSIMGPSAAGKSTLAKALIGIVPQSTGGRIHGKVTVDGRDVRVDSIASNAQRIGLVAQDPETQFFNLDVESEVAYGPESQGLPPAEIAGRVAWALERVGMQGFRDRSPFELSGGEKQRVAIAAILAMRPRVLVLDEPTTSLDPRGTQEVFETLAALRQEGALAVLLISQDSERVAEFSDRVIALEAGKIAVQGTPQQVFSQEDLTGSLGIRTPQVLQLSSCLNRRLGTRYSFLDLEQAALSLRRDLQQRRDR